MQTLTSQIKNKAIRLYKKIISNLTRLGYRTYYNIFERFKISYTPYMKKVGRRQFKTKYPGIAFASFEEVHFLIHLESQGVMENLIVVDGEYAVLILEVARHFIKQDSVIIDVGANIGYYSLYFAKKYPDCSVYGYEPGSLVFESFEKSKNLNRLHNLFPCNMAVGREHTTMVINAATQQTHNKGAASLKANYDVDSTFIKQSTRVIPLNDHLKKEKKVSFIKIDVQGFEKDVFDGAWDLIERDRPAIVFEHTDTYYETPLEVRKHISSQFQSLNYEIYLLCQWRKIFDYKFLEHIDFGEAPFIDGDLLATPLEN